MTKLEEKWHGMLFSVRRSIRYHNSRRAFFDRLDKWTTFFTIASGGGVLVTARIEDGAPLTLLFGGLTSLLATIDLVLEFSISARDHYDLVKRFIELEKEMVQVGDSPTEDDYKKVCATRLAIEADEPNIYRALDIQCHNQLVLAMGQPEDRYVLPWYISIFKQFFMFGGLTFKPLKAS